MSAMYPTQHTHTKKSQLIMSLNLNTEGKESEHIRISSPEQNPRVITSKSSNGWH